ncbi:putative haloacid dehalogenase-like hydrolase [Ascoidea rubescens DSM 1968]|uniref:HAD-like protein n=1 Tax=Ascoidea rubescens DSM 1968 TaxID=1344418 RepID=A0A1D2VLE1_9ASCO|nr:HAD-like protein [Ascoidea rubescens DSM 1968]ODV62405.1 HAD-like protein [Ascoidea rubescens DSM 1968]
MSSNYSRRLILNPVKENDYQIKGIVFDMDGTLCVAQTWMFQEMRDALNITKKIDIIDHLNSIADENVKFESHYKIFKIEEKAMNEMKPQNGLFELMKFLDKNDIKKTICTRNNMTPVIHFKSKFLNDTKLNEPIITRDFFPPKPSPKPILHIAEKWGINPKNLIMVGDSLDDMRAGANAGCGTILISSDANEHLKTIPETDFVIDSLFEIILILENGLNVKDKSSLNVI